MFGSARKGVDGRRRVVSDTWQIHRETVDPTVIVHMQFRECDTCVR
jgi:hypothetical protein